MTEIIKERKIERKKDRKNEIIYIEGTREIKIQRCKERKKVKNKTKKERRKERKKDR